MRRFILTAFVLSVCVSLAQGQTPAPRGELGLPFITSYSQRDYEAAPDNWAVVQDKRGIVYFGNQWGVLEYDGVSWRFIATENLTYARSFALHESGRVYVGMSGDMGYLAPDSLGRTTIVSLLDDVPEDFRTFADVWHTFVMGDDVFFSSDEGLMRWRNGEVTVWRGSHHVAGVVNGTLYIREFGRGILHLKDDELTLVPDGERFADERVYVYLPYDDERMLIATRTQGMFLYDGNTFTPFKTEADDYITANQVYLPGAALSDGSFAFGTLSGGLVQIDHEGYLIRILDIKTGLPDNTVAYIHEDARGGVWLALGNGAAHVDLGSPFTVFDRRSGLKSTPFRPLRHNGRIYFGGLTGASYLNPETSQIESATGEPIPSLDLLSFNDALLNAGMTSGLTEIRKGRNYIVAPADNNQNVANALARSEVDTNVVFVALRGGVGATERQPDGRWKDIGRLHDLDGQPNSIQIDSLGTIWLGAGESGVYRLEVPLDGGRYAFDRSEVRYYGADKGLPEHGTSVHLLGGQILGSTGTGIFRYDRHRDLFEPDKSIPAVRFSPAEESHRIVADKAGNAWAEFGFEPFHGTRQPDGSYQWTQLLFDEISGATLLDIYPEGDITWFSTLDGLIRYDLARGNSRTAPPQPLIRSIALRSDSLLFGGLLPIGEELAVEMRPDQNSFRVTYAAPNYSSGRLLYATILDGFDLEWSPWEAGNEKSYTNLSPGTYRFRVKARTATGLESSEASVDLRILPHWYETWWAYLLYTLGGLGAVGGFVSVRTSKLRDRQRELERTVEERTTEIRQRVEELGVINSVQQGLVAEMDMQGIYELVGERIRDLFDAQVVVIRTFDHENKLEVFEYGIEKGERLSAPPRKSDGFGLHLASLREPLLLNTGFTEYANKFSTSGPFAGEAPKAAVFVPLIVADEVRGNISLQNVDRENAFKESDLRLLTTLANSMSVALENARLFDQTTRLLADADQRATEMATVNRISQALVSQLEFDALVRLVGDQIQQTFHADMAYVAFLDKEEAVINFPYGYGDEFNPIEYGEGFTSQIIRTGEALLVNEDVGGRFEELGLKEIGKRSASYLGVPISVGGEVVGVVSVQSTQAAGRFDDDDLHLLSTIAANVGIALQNAEAYRRLNETLQNLKSTQEQLVTQEKMASLGQLTAGIAHEIKNPLNFVNNFAELNAELAQEAGEMFDRYRSRIPDELAAELIPMLTGISVNAQQIHKHGKRADGIVKNMMEHATGTSSERYRVEVNPLVDEYVGLAFHGAKAQMPELDAKVVKDFDSAVGIASLAPQEIGRVLLNLVNNALYAVHEKAQQANGEYTPTVSVKTRRLADAIEIRVADNGKGIPSEIRDRIFEPLFTTKPTGSGTGLGLSLSFDIVTQGHGGSLRVESEAGQGAEFVVSIPLR